MDFASGQSLHWAAVLAFDDRALAGCIERAGGGSRAGAGDRLAADLARGWLALMRGEAVDVEPRLPGLFAQAAATRDPERVIETTVLRAMVALGTGKLADAVAFARRASLMARTEALPAAELLANLALARVRRHSGKPHLAVRILEALARLAPRTPRGWLDWELLLAGGARPDALATGDDDPSPGARAVRAGHGLLLAARSGSRAVFEREAAELVAVTATCVDVQNEARALVELVDPERPISDSHPAALASFRRGDSAELAYGLFAAGEATLQQEPATTIFAVARPGWRGVRILRDGLGLLGPCRVLSRDEGTRRTHGRTDAALAVLVLSSPSSSPSSPPAPPSPSPSLSPSPSERQPMPELEFFQQVYGFAYLDASHRGVLDVLVHRMRRRIDGCGTVVRSNGTLALELGDAIAVADPRCSPPASARILSALARQPLATADSIATRLGISVRSAQVALRQLVSDGVCAMRKSGRAMEFQLQDSAFCEPTGNDILGT